MSLWRCLRKSLRCCFFAVDGCLSCSLNCICCLRLKFDDECHCFFRKCLCLPARSFYDIKFMRRCSPTLEEILVMPSKYSPKCEIDTTSSLLWCVQGNDVQTATTLLQDSSESEVNVCHMWSINCRPVLHDAVAHGNAELVALLLEAGASVNASTQQFESGISEEGGLTPLDVAHIHKDATLIEFLTANGGVRGRPGVTRWLT